MTREGVLYGLLDTSAAIGDPRVAAKCRDLTITWSRYDYHGPVIEGASIDAVLDGALAQPARYCFIQSPGWIIRERWNIEQTATGTFLSALQEWMDRQEAMVAGRIRMAPGAWFGVDPECLLVDLARFEACGRPRFGEAEAAERELPVPVVVGANGDVGALRPSARSATAAPKLPGWHFVVASLRQGLQVLSLPDVVRGRLVDFVPRSPEARRCLRTVLDKGVEAGAAAPSDCSPEQGAFLESVATQASNARRGVFLVNIESYADIETPPPDFQGPVSTLYTVASGLKPNRILQTHGMGVQTRVVFFDYSERALAVRREMIEKWDGTDLPGFIRHLFSRFPPPDTFYQLWADCTAESMDWEAVEVLWRRDLDRLGGEPEFREHWRRYRRLDHVFVHCDLLTDPGPVFAQMREEPGAVIWFSNAPFTVHSNWRFMIDERKAMYERWIDGLVRRNPGMLLYGSDYANANVNCLSAGRYASLYREQDQGPLGAPLRCRHTIRM